MLVCMCSHESHGIPLRFHELKEVTKRPLIMLMVRVILLIYDVNHNVSIRVSFIFFQIRINLYCIFPFLAENWSGWVFGVFFFVVVFFGFGFFFFFILLVSKVLYCFSSISLFYYCAFCLIFSTFIVVALSLNVRLTC